MMILRYRLLLLVCCAWPLAGVAADTPAAAGASVHSNAESRLLAVFNLAQQGAYDSAINDLSDLIEAKPNFRLAQLVYGELMVARTGRSIDPEISASMRDQRDALLDEAKTRWAHRMAASNDGKVPSAILQIAPEYKHVIVVDLSSNRLYLFANEQGVPRLVSDFYATIGSGGAGKQTEGDMRTPIGIYHVTRYLNDNMVPELYGVGALPINYPNALDRARGRTGYGIWLHGVPRTTYARTPRASEGCVVIANDDFAMLKANVAIGKTPVILTAGLDWVPVATLEKQRDSLLAAVENWHHSWQSIDTQAQSYLAYYAPDFVSEASRDKAMFAGYEKEANAVQTDISVDLSQISLFHYPGEQRMVRVAFTQEPSSSNYQSEAHKAQYWQQNDEGKWQIVLETEDD